MPDHRSQKKIAQRFDLEIHRRPLSRARRWRRIFMLGSAAGLLLLLLLYAWLGDGRAFWAGPLIDPHQAKFLDSTEGCAMCHARAERPLWRLVSGSRTSSVTDEKCQKCHADGATAHYDHAGLGPQAATPSCAACHEEHRGGQVSLTQTNDVHCVGCHAGLEAFHPEPTFFARIKSFAAHPEFAASRFRGGLVVGGKDVPGDKHAAHARVDFREGAAVDRAALIFSHTRHLAEAGIPGPQADQLEKLECRACHQADSTGRQMLPISFDSHCARCHQPKLPISGDKSEPLPHDTITKVYEAARSFLPDNPQWPATQQQVNAGCLKCHLPRSQPDAAELDLLPTKIPRRWFPYALFSHDRHGDCSCISCHDPQAGQEDILLATGEDPENERFIPSDKAGDILLPTIEVCRKCHVASGRSDWVPAPSSCVTCHSYHAKSTAVGHVLGGVP